MNRYAIPGTATKLEKRPADWPALTWNGLPPPPEYTLWLYPAIEVTWRTRQRGPYPLSISDLTKMATQAEAIFETEGNPPFVGLFVSAALHENGTEFAEEPDLSIVLQPLRLEGEHP